jgi:hypothetical protein
VSVQTEERDSSEVDSGEDVETSGVSKEFFFVGRESETILPSPCRQTIDNVLNPAFNGARAPGTVVNGDVVHMQ